MLLFIFIILPLSCNIDKNESILVVETTTTAVIETSTSTTDSVSWSKSYQNPVLVISPITGDEDYRQIDQVSLGTPHVIQNTSYKNYKYWMYYAGADGTSNNGSLEDDKCQKGYHHGLLKYIGLAFSVDGIEWTKYSKYGENGIATAIIDPTNGTYDEGGCLSPHVIFDGSIYRMWYTGVYFDDDPQDYNYPSDAHPTNFYNYLHHCIMYAESSDGITWVKKGRIAKLAPADDPYWLKNHTLGPWVIKDGNTYKMWFTGCRNRAFDAFVNPDTLMIEPPYEPYYEASIFSPYSEDYHTIGAANCQIGYAEMATPGSGNWTNDQNWVRAANSIKEPNFKGWDNSFINIISGWRFSAATEVSVLKISDKKYYMFYHAGVTSSSIGLSEGSISATSSSNTITWGSGTEILTKGNYYTWEGGGLRAPSVLIDKDANGADCFKLWYQGTKFGNRYYNTPSTNNYDISNIGFATAIFVNTSSGTDSSSSGGATLGN